MGTPAWKNSKSKKRGSNRVEPASTVGPNQTSAVGRTELQEDEARQALGPKSDWQPDHPLCQADQKHKVTLLITSTTDSRPTS